MGEDGGGANGQWRRENGTLAEGDRPPRPEKEEEEGEEEGREVHKEAGRAAQLKEEDEEEEEPEEGAEEDTPFHPFIFPGESRPKMFSDFKRKESF